VYQNRDEFSEYREDSSSPYELDYAHPEYYQSSSTPSQHSAQPEQHPDPYAAYSDPENYADTPVYSPYDTGMVNEYRGPQSMEGYTSDVGVEQREAAEHGSAEGGKKRKGLAGIGSALTAIGALLLKLKGALFLLKFGFAGFTALISIAVYALIFGWTFAIGIVALLFIHEMGHALVMRLKGIPVGGLIFIPLLGAAVTMRQMPANARDEAEVGIAGPIAGAIASSFCLYLAQLQPHVHTIWAPLAYFGFFINLFNLVPIVPFDGGRVLAAIDRRVWVIGFLALLAFQVWSWLQGNFSLWLLFFVFIAGAQLWSRGLRPDTPEAREYYNVPVGTRIVLTLLYFGLAGVLFLGMTMAHSLMPIPTSMQ